MALIRTCSDVEKERNSNKICRKGDLFAANTTMNQDNEQDNNPDALDDFLLKRKRGRPRKHPKHDLNQGENAQMPWNQNLNHAENAHVPPGFGAVNGNRPHQVNPDANDVMVGQAVSGVIEAAFDAGYLLTVRVGNSDTTLRGVVFKPGHYVPVSAENDVAPNLQMIRRNKIPFPRERNGTAHPLNGPALANQVPRARASNLGAIKNKNVQPAATQFNSLLSRGTVVPVVLQPASLSNGKVSSQQLSQPPHLVSKGKQLSGAANATNEEKPVNQIPTVGNPIFPTQPQPRSSNHTVPKGIQSETVSYSQLPADGLQDKDAKSMTGMPFEKLLSEVMKRVQVPLQPPEVQGGNLSVKELGNKLEDDQALSIEPLQAVQSTHSSSMLKPLENFRTGKMTELLQAVQENMRENQASRIEQPAISSEGTMLRDKATHDSNKQS
ncbi:hypothetical protein ERO13_D13G143200v2 [Gossypium hirsutum]|uniref:Uncharacterized protein LOC107919831 isoform X1 n=9 Tax=Gossypium TaxID=3633 RepID=A0A1U8KQI8_GOSHI|nr:uncharacterized protein LOC107919831 isoform X1 [Gossypium hirsutum]XP_016704704.1 uncharacterized protein LOC107919831 isoform X1 [Gossypium hirsutum]XP_016704705.1 uncharacterized protein LOC107919831 isoform X1 [Gossypium hirsutum]XP_016704706.1 uncharacterized protein LOC107919831 isoform X1 [Gossypium hirsutum]KAB1995461.1 hypothetical protein ES319_D13G163000v1 [Gossypium barbadense]TYG37858.1 hypothetical protein ES288_D13G174800v1 [Gossypium darwinii]TYI47347.1 hypothetical protein